MNHNLQPEANLRMETHAQNIAIGLGTKWCSESIPWGHEPFPPKPEHGAPLEEIARAARQNRLLNAMLEHNIHCIGFGHHADDQVETAIMRLMKGSGETGAAGMRPVRRWGMGNSGLDAAGVHGMSRWIVRPLLEVSKVGILLFS